MILKDRLNAMSTDQIGLLGSAKQMRVITPSYIDRVEVIAAGGRKRVSRLSHELEEEGFTVSRLHGRTGISGKETLVHKGILFGMNAGILSTRTLLNEFKQHEVLIHVSEACARTPRKQILQARPKNIWIENHDSGTKGAMDTIFEVSRLRQKGIKAKVMFDLWHMVNDRDATENFARLFDRAVNFLYVHTQNQNGVISGVHFPIGTQDALPIDSLTNFQLEYISSAIGPSVREVVFENQRKDGLLFLPRSLEQNMFKRTSRILDRLAKFGILRIS